MHLLLVLASLAPSRAAEVQFEGFYRARYRGFDTLSLDRSLALDEGYAGYAQHRLWLKPKFLLSDKVAMFVEIKGLDNVLWGDEPGVYDPDNFGVAAPNVFEYDLNAPTADAQTGDRSALLDLTLWRAWGEVYTPIGQFSFGRMPLMWGTGMWLNDGVTVDPDFADYGDTTDRVMWEQLFQNQFYLRATVDVPTERFVGTGDDTTALGIGVAYKAEDLTAGILLQLDHTGPREPAQSLNVFTADAAGDVTLGKLTVEAEFVGQFGGGDFEDGVNDASITAIGASLNASLDLDVWNIGVRGGLATGDANPTNDRNFKTFTFDRDYSVGMFLFEQPMPTLAIAQSAANDVNGGRDFTEVVSGSAISNAIFGKPTVSRRIVDGLTVDASWLGALVAKSPALNGVNQRRGYGNEFQLGVRYDGIPHFAVDGRAGLFLPGSVYSVEPDGKSKTGYDDPAFGVQLTGRIDF